MQELVKWKRNDFVTFYAQMKIRIGGQTETYVIDEGEEFEFDGSVCRYNGSEFSQPGLKGAIKAGWATTDPEGMNALPAAHRPDRNVAVAKSVNRDLNHVQRTPKASIGISELDEQTVMDISQRSDAMTSGRHIDHTDNRRYASARGLRIDSSQMDDQDAIPVSRIRTPAKASVDVAANPGAARAIENGLDYEKGFGRSNVIHKEGVDIRMNVGHLRGASIAESEDEGVVVGHVRKSKVRNQEGIEVMDTSNINQQSKAASKAAKAAPKEAPKAKKDSAAPSPKLVQAQQVYSDFPADWNFFGKTEDKLSKLEEIGASGPLVKALFASESKAMKKALKEKYSNLL